MTFLDVHKTRSWAECAAAIHAKTRRDVERALTRPRGKVSLDDFQALVSPAAAPYLETMAQLSHAGTVERFGFTQQIYAPVYLSNVCRNYCAYCGFNAANRIPRRTLNTEEMVQEFRAVKSLGIDHVLLVTGEGDSEASVPYLQTAIRIARKQFSSIAMEVQPLEQADYEPLIEAGLSSVMIYQETYNRAAYAQYHVHGPKRDFAYRLQTPDRLGKAGIKKIGLGALYGLEDWRTDGFHVAAHLRYMEQTYWKTHYSLSFPRIRPHEGMFQPKACMNDRELIQLICACRLFSPEVELSLSTRETEHFRDHACRLGITSMSAGSKTSPGGYAVAPQALEQFEISDARSPAAVAGMLQQRGYAAIWKDWDPTYDGQEML
ncbi:MAG: 2-iminoacetate synthase ThiH [Kiritimatiellia bacterium]